MNHQPAGGMCRTCTHMLRNCSDLPFSTMQPIKRDGRDIIVRCTDYVRATSPLHRRPGGA